LAAYYNNSEDSEVRKLLRRYLALPLIPANEIPVECDRMKVRIRNIVDPAARRKMIIFHDSYIVGFWIKQVRPERFSVYMHAFKTNNHVESFHARLKDKLSFHGNFFRFMSEMDRFVFTRTERMIRQLDRGEQIHNDLTADRARMKE
jgi:hypothetical protein